jgi:flagellar motility protein MotE (MotC chaperone)
MMTRISLPGSAGVLRLPFGGRFSLVAVMAGVAGLTAIANALAASAPAEQAPPTRLGASLQQSAQERDETLARQKRALDMREQAVEASQARLKADLEGRQPAPRGSRPDDRAATDRGETPYDELARIYQTMKPARAAPIFERLDLDVQMAVARRMRERSTALLMASMTPDAAVRLSMALAGKRVEERPRATPSTPERAPNARPSPSRGPVGGIRPKAAQGAPKPTMVVAPQKS